MFQVQTTNQFRREATMPRRVRGLAVFKVNCPSIDVSELPKQLGGRPEPCKKKRTLLTARGPIG